MTKTRASIWLAALLSSAGLALGGCSAGGEDNGGCNGGKCDDLDPSETACGARVMDQSGTGRTVGSILGNDDQFAKFVLVEGDDCPTQATAVMAKLNDVTACGSEANGTMIVNEKSSHDSLRGDDVDESLLRSAQNANRTVVSRQCAVPPEPADEPSGEMKPCVGSDVEEFDFVMDACADSNNTPNCFNDESGASFFQSQECVACLTKGDDRLHKDDLRTGDRRCLDRDAAPVNSGDRPEPFTLLFSTFSSIDKLSEGGMEIMAFDESEGIFNFYKESGGGWAFMGNSKDFQEGNGGFCKGCHPSGGVVMKELASPWQNWDIAGDVPHSDDVIASNPDFFGSAFPLGGEGLELDIARPGNEVMNDKRADRIAARFTAAKDARSSDRASFADENAPVFTEDEVHEMLKPLFCTEQINIVNNTFSSDGIFKPDFLDQNTRISIPSGEYQTAIENLGQTRGTGALTSTDSSSRLARPSNADVYDGRGEGFYRKMVERSLLSDEFIQDLHMIDFTRPLFSDARCGLLEFAPEISVADAKDAESMAAAIEAGFIAKLTADENRSAAATEFLTSLTEGDSSMARAETYQTFADACSARSGADPLAFMTDVVKMAELMRQETETRLEIIENFLAADVWPSIPGMSRNFSRWSPTTCELE